MIKTLFSKCKSLSLIAGLMLFFCIDIDARLSAALQGELASAKIAAPKAIQQKPGVAVLPSGQDEYVQSEAQLQLPDVEEKMAKVVVTPYLNIFAQALNREVQFKNSHYAFYHAGDSGWRVPQDLYKKLYIHFKKPSSILDDFVFLRFSNAKSLKAQDFLTKNISKYAGVNDTIQEVKEVLLSANIAFFGNVGFSGEFTWNYFLETKSHQWPAAQNYNDVINSFNLTYDIELLAKETQVLSEMLANASPEQVLIQIFIPQNKVDDVAYLSWVLGFPAHPKSVALMEERLKGKPRIGVHTFEAVKAVMKKFKNNPNDPVYKELVKAAADGDFGISWFMEVMRNNPFSLENVNETQARILLTKEVLEPNYGTKMFVYVTTPNGVQTAYDNKLTQLASKIIDQESRKTPLQKAADREKNEATMARIKAGKKE